ASIRPSGLKATDHAGLDWSFGKVTTLPEATLTAALRTLDHKPGLSLKVRSSLPVSTSQSFIVLSQLPLANIRPSGLKAIEITLFECPVSFRSLFPVITSQSSIALLLTPGPASPLANIRPSGLKATELTNSLSATNVRSSRPFAVSQSLIALPRPVVARTRPSGLKDIEKIQPGPV